MAFKRILLRRDTSSNWTSGNAVLSSGEIGYETNTGKFKIGNGSTAWTSLAYSVTTNLAASVLNDLGDVTITSAADGDFLRWNGTAWINDAVNLSTDTIGSFVQSLVAGTGVTLSNNSGENATPTIAVNTSVIQARVADVSDTEIGYLNGVTSAVQTQIDTKAPLASPTFTGTVVLPDNTVALGTKTTGDYVATITGGTGVASTASTTGEGTTHTLSIGQAVGTTDNVTFAGVTADAITIGVTAAGEIDTTSGNLTIDSAGGTVTVDDNLTVTGNLTVSGTTTSINTETLTVDDNIIILNNNITGSPSENAGIEVERGTSANVSVRWNETNDKWEVTNDGSVYGNIVTSADSGTITSAMILDGTIVNADINASAAIVDTKLATISTAGKVSNSATTATDANTANAIVARDASGNFTAGTITGALSGNASTATTLATARNIAGQSFNGSANISIAPTDLTGVTSTAAEINILDGATLTVTELNYVDGVTSAIQTQLDAKAPLASPTFTGTPSLPTGTTAVTQTLGNNTTAVATTAFIQTALANFGGMTVSDTAPSVDVGAGDFWYDSTGLNLYIYYGSSWVQVTIDEPILFELSELIGVVIGDLLPNQTLRFDGVSGNWVNSAPRQNIANSSLTTYGVTSTNSGNMIVLDSSSAVSVNLGTWTDVNVGEKVDIVQKGTGQVTVTVSGSVSVVSPGNSVTTRARYSTVTATCIGINLFLLSGDLT